jgi:cation diffusion facilitator family transporter
MSDRIQPQGRSPIKLNSRALQSLRMRIILISLAVGTALMGLKFLTYHLTHSAAVLSDALESIINVVAGAFATLSVWMSAKPPDKEHPYGHGKIEYFSAGFEGALIIMAAAGIFYSGIEHLQHPRQLPNLAEGLIILLAATGFNMLLGIWLVSNGRKTDSITLVADGKHILTDAYTSGGVLLGLVLVYYTGLLWLDGAVACLVGINILNTGAQLIRQSIARLMDASDPLLLEKIAVALERHRRPEWIDIHQLRAWRAGSFIHIDLHLVLPRDLSIDHGHAEAKAVELMLINEFNGNASVLVHSDPCEATQCPVCSQKVCRWRSRPLDARLPWEIDQLVRSLASRDADDADPAE